MLISVCEVCEAKPPGVGPHCMQATLIFNHYRHIKIKTLSAVENGVFRVEDLRCLALPAELRSQMSPFLISFKWFIDVFYCFYKFLPYRE